MRAEEVIATHANTDFDALASMLAARRLYPGAVVCLSGSLNRNVRDFYRLHADELGALEASRLDTEAVRRLIVVETVHATRLGELEQLAPVEVDGVEVLVAPVRWPTYVDGVSNLAHKLVDLTNCQALVLLVEMDERVFAVARSRTPFLDAGLVARSLGGGGHPQAASAIFRGTLAEAHEQLLS